MGHDHARETGAAGESLPPLPRVPADFDARAVTVAPGGRLPYRDADWDDALVVVERGAIELESVFGVTATFERGAVLWLTGLGLRALHNRWSEPAVLLAISRRSPCAGRRTMPR